MKKIFKIFLAVIMVAINFTGFANITIAEELNGSDVLNRIDSSEAVMLNLINNLTVWSNNHANDLKGIINKELLDSMSSDDLNIDFIINKLNAKGYYSAASDLEGIKSSIKSDASYLRTTLQQIADYLENDPVSDGVDEVDILYHSRSVFRNVKSPLKALIKIYYDLYYNDINSKIDNISSYDELMEIYDNIADRLVDTNNLYSKFKEKWNRFKNIYDSKSLEIYEPAFKEEFRSIYNTFKTDYNKLYNRLEQRLQTKLDEKIDNIITGVDITDFSEVNTANGKLDDIMNKINTTKNKIQTKFNQLNELVNGVHIIEEYYPEYENKIIDRLVEAYDYTESKKLTFASLILSRKNGITEKEVKIDNDRALVIYNSKDLTPLGLLNKLTVNYGDLREVTTYSGKIGTKSIIEAYYGASTLKQFTIVVRGDIKCDGRVDITDIVKFFDKMYGETELDEYQMLAADFDDNSKIDITDMVKLFDRFYG